MQTNSPNPMRNPALQSSPVSPTFRFRQRLDSSPALNDVESACPSSELEEATLAGSVRFTSAFGPGPRGRLRPPSSGVSAMAAARPSPPEPTTQMGIGLGLLNVPQLRSSEMLSVSPEPEDVSRAVGLGIAHLKLDSDSDEGQSPVPQPNVQAASPWESNMPIRWSRHSRRHAEQGRVFPRRQAPDALPNVAGSSRRPAQPESHKRTFDQFSGYISQEYVPIRDDAASSASSSQAPSPSLRDRAQLYGSRPHKRSSASPAERSAAPGAPALASAEWGSADRPARDC